MMEHRRRRLPRVLMALGAAMALFALGMLSQTRDALQYCALAPEAGEKGAAIQALADSAVRLGEEMKDALGWTALGGSCGVVSLTGGAGSADANVIAMGEGWMEVYPLFVRQGRRIGESELRQGAPAILLDEALAFRLIGNDFADGARVRLNNVEYSVVGTVRHAGSLLGGRGVGDTVEYDAYVPLRAAAENGLPIQTLTLSAVSAGGPGASQLFREAAERWMPGGELVDLGKESMRCTVLPRVLLLIVSLYALVGLFRRMTLLASGWFAGFREALKGSYMTALLPRLLGIVALTLLGYGALIGATYLLMVFSARPLYVFTEWVPENIVEWSSIAKVFWSLTASAGSLVRVGTRELRVIAFWGGLLRWGTVLLLLGAALLPKARGQREAKESRV